MKTKTFVLLTAALVLGVLLLPCVSSNAAPNEEAKAYFAELTEVLGPWQMGLYGIAEQSGLAGANVALMFDEDWRIKTAVYLVLLKNAEPGLKKITPPARFRPVHQELLKAGKASTQAADLYASAVDEVSPEKMEAASRKMNEVTTAINRATALMSKLGAE